MVLGKIVTKFIQTLPTWEVTKYYGRVCLFQLKCLKYRIQTSEAWFNFKCKFMSGSLQDELECEDVINKAKDDHLLKQQKIQKEMLSSENLNPKETNKFKQKGKPKLEKPLSPLDCDDDSSLENEFGTEYKKEKHYNDKQWQNQAYTMDQKYKQKRKMKRP